MNIGEAQNELQGAMFRSIISLRVRASELKLENLGLSPEFIESLGNLDPISQEKCELFRKIVNMTSKTVEFDSEVVFTGLEHAEFIYPCMSILLANEIDLTQKNSKGVSFRDVIHDKHKSTFNLLQMANLIK